jgi:hypothetical protein
MINFVIGGFRRQIEWFWIRMIDIVIGCVWCPVNSVVVIGSFRRLLLVDFWVADVTVSHTILVCQRNEPIENDGVAKTFVNLKQKKSILCFNIVHNKAIRLEILVRGGEDMEEPHKRIIKLSKEICISCLFWSRIDYTMYGAGATYDWMFFDNSKLIYFDD